MKNSCRLPARIVAAIHFEDLSGADFERLVFAYHCRSEVWKSLEWYGQVGGDLGRDIWLVRDNTLNETICIQCVNRSRLTFAKAQGDVAKVQRAPHGLPQIFRFVARSTISAPLRDRIKGHVLSLGVDQCDLWSGVVFEEFLRNKTESLLKRLVEGEVFPDAESDLKAVVRSVKPLDDDEALRSLARIFQRPAFYTPIYRENGWGDFRQAITDTICALGTGMWKTRDGDFIDRVPMRHQFKSASVREHLQTVELSLARLRTKYDELVKAGVLQHCACDDPHCTVFTLDSPDAAQELERLREDALNAFRMAYPDFELPSW